MRRGKFERFQSRRNQQHYFALKAGNGKVIAVSEGYTTAAMRDKGIRSVRRVAPFARVNDELTALVK